MNVVEIITEEPTRQLISDGTHGVAVCTTKSRVNASASQIAWLLKCKKMQTEGIMREFARVVVRVVVHKFMCIYVNYSDKVDGS